jgi:hypothetical protein
MPFSLPNDSCYPSLRTQMKPGDIIAFSGKDIPAQVVKLATKSQYVHIAIVAWVDQRAGQNDGILIAESHIDISLPSVGTGDRRLGVQFQWLSDRLTTQPGPIWWIPLQTTLAPEGEGQLRHWLQLTEEQKVPYDFKQAIGVGLGALGFGSLNREDDAAYFCSELVVRALQEAGVLDRQINPAAKTPADVIQMACFGEPVLIKEAGLRV